jgi:hypothetical protein
MRSDRPHTRRAHCIKCLNGEDAERGKWIFRNAKLRAGDYVNERDKRLRYNYGITLAQYEELATRQKNGCAICGGASRNGRPLDVDHDHKTGRVRELLCNNCNQGLGSFKDDINKLEAAMIYLKKWSV